jgi:hypothetical protein
VLLHVNVGFEVLAWHTRLRTEPYRLLRPVASR